MKIKHLQVNVLALLFGVSILFFTMQSNAKDAANFPLSGQHGEEDGGELRRIQANQVTGEINMEDVVAGRQQTAKHTKRGSQFGLQWEFKGPHKLSGPVSSVLVPEDNGSLVYIGTKHGGIFKSQDAGNTWSRMAVEKDAGGVDKALFVTCLAIKSPGTIYAGTGGDFPGQGIYRSIDGGAFTLMQGTENWQIIYRMVTYNDKIFAATSDGVKFFDGTEWHSCIGTMNNKDTVLHRAAAKDIAINKDGLVIVSFNNMCFISQTANHNGFKYSEIPGVTPNNTSNLAVAVAHNNTSILYLSVAGNNGRLSGAFLTENKGETWRKVFQAHSSSSLTIDPLDGNGKDYNRIWVDPKSDTVIYIASNRIWYGKKYTPTGFYDFSLDALTLLTGSSIHSGINDIAFFNKEETEFKDLFVASQGGILGCVIYPSLRAYSSIDRVNDALTIASTNKIAVTIDNDRNECYIIGGTPTLNNYIIGESTNTNKIARGFWNIEPGAKLYNREGAGGPCATSLINEDFFIYSALINGTYSVRRSDDNGNSYQPTGDSWFDASRMPSVSYMVPFITWETFNAEYTPDSIWFTADTTRNYFSGEKVVYAKSKLYSYPIRYEIPEPMRHGDSIQVPDLVQHRMYYAGRDKIVMTRHAMDLTKIGTSVEWFTIAKMSNDTASCLAVSQDGNNLFIGTRAGNLYRISNLLHATNLHNADIDSAGENFILDTMKIHSFGNRMITSIAVNPTDPNHVMVMLGNYGNESYIYESANALADNATFASAQYNLPKIPVYTGIITKEDEILIIGTEMGMYVKGRNSSEWIKDGGNIGNLPVHDIIQITTERPGVKGVPYVEGTQLVRINYPNNLLNYLGIYAATYGGGIYYADKYVNIETPEGPENPTAKGNLVLMPNPTSNIATFEIDMKAGATARVQVFDISGRCVQDQTISSSQHTIDLNGHATGIYFVRVTQGTTVQSGKLIKTQ